LTPVFVYFASLNQQIYHFFDCAFGVPCNRPRKPALPIFSNYNLHSANPIRYLVCVSILHADHATTVSVSIRGRGIPAFGSSNTATLQETSRDTIPLHRMAIRATRSDTENTTL
jgi:hypothetical protein